jgi:RNA polymerase sigma-70 factor (ECF subfamily)
LKFVSFNEDYVRRLTDGDPDAGEHFAAYFGGLLFLKLRTRLRSLESIEDVRQETLKRVLLILREGRGVQHPEHFGAFVNGVCNNVLREFRRLDERAEPWDDNNMDEPIDNRVDLDAELVNADLKRLIGQIFAAIPDRDRRILKALYLDEIDRTEASRMFNVNPRNLRVIVCRAKDHFRGAYRGAQVYEPGEIAP